jgi:hypothetical protein
MVVFAPRETMAQGWMVTVAGALIEMLFGTEWVTPFPAQVSLALMLLVWVTTVPVAGAQLAAPVTATVVLPERVGSATLVAVMVYVPAAVLLKAAVFPSGESVPPVALQDTAVEHGPLEVTVAVRLAVPPAAMVEGFAATETPATTQLEALLLTPRRSIARRALFNGST